MKIAELLKGHQHVLIAVSGGVDSMALLHKCAGITDIKISAQCYLKRFYNNLY